jgi:acylphosphatase
MGMKKYSHWDEDPYSVSLLPWPYNRKLACTQGIGFGTFVRSQEAQRDVDDYYRVIQNSGSIESLILFVAHHPFCTPALLQLSSVMYQTNHNAEGYQLLRRVLWIYECAAASIGWSNRLQDGKVEIAIDRNQPENADFFQTLFQLMKISNIAG